MFHAERAALPIDAVAPEADRYKRIDLVERPELLERLERLDREKRVEKFGLLGKGLRGSTDRRVFGERLEVLFWHKWLIRDERRAHRVERL